MNSIGLDAHSSSFTMGVVDSKGKVRRCLTRPTSEENLIELVAAVPGPKQLTVEESHLAQWVKDALEPYVDKLMVCDPKQNRWIAKDDFADDRSSAIKLAQLLRGGFLKEVVHPKGQGVELRGLFLHYFDLNRQLARHKNKLKAMFRSVAIKTKGSNIYEPGQSKIWLPKLKGYPHLAHRARHFFALVETFAKYKVQTHKAMVTKAKKMPAYKVLLTIRGVGPMIATGYLAMIQTPHRFSRKNKLWRYAGLSNVYHESDQVVYKDKATKTGNRVLKWVVEQHFQAAVSRARRPNRFTRQYLRLLAGGLKRKEARRQVCRRLLSVVRAVWIEGQPYREQ